MKSGNSRPASRSRRPRITVHHGSWWFDDPASDHERRLDPLFAPCHWNLGNLAAALDIGERTLSRIIEESTGQTGKVWLRHIRIVRAIHLLRESPKIEALARHLGFSQHSDLTREFKKLVGILPSEFLKQERKRFAIPDESIS